MNHKELGQTGIRLPEIGLGTWQYKGGVECLRAGMNCGACLIDTAESYGTEEMVGLATREVRGSVLIATKVSRVHFKYADLIQAADKSLQRIGTDYIDLYQLHGPNMAAIEETMAAMEHLVDMGKVRFIGVSNFSVADLRKAQAALAKNKIVSNQVSYSLVNRSIEIDVMRYCQENHITIIAYSPLAHGIDRIIARDPEGILSRLASALGRTESQVALNWCTSKEGVVAIPKADSTRHTMENCKASGWRLSPDQIKSLEESFHSPAAWGIALPQVARRALQKLGYRL
jgi:diketogulonate reductase-like aldo/keto reductase